MQALNKVYCIGIGYKPLDRRAREIILNSRIILSYSRLSEVFKGYEEFERVKDRIRVISNVDETVNFIRTHITDSDVCLLVSGDPMFFGIGGRVVKEFGKERVELFPELSSLQVAFSRIKETWGDAFLMTLHGGPDPEKRRRLPYTINDIPSLLQRHNKIAILTDRENNPSEIAGVLNLSPVANSILPVMYVCERLGYPDEKITEGKPEEISKMTFSDPNVVIIRSGPSTGWAPRPPETEVRFGLKENEILHSKGMITKGEVRAVTIHKLRFPQIGVLYDIGAGSGSVSIEAARLYPELKVFAIEMDEEQINNIKENRIRFSASNIEIVKGDAPDALKGLPFPDRVFIGGSGGKLKGIIDLIAKRKAEIVVINAATIETLSEAIKSLEDNGYGVEISEVAVSRSKDIAGRRHMDALNPVFIITGEKSL